jgi:hypothetical protein
MGIPCLTSSKFSIFSFAPGIGFVEQERGYEIVVIKEKLKQTNCPEINPAYLVIRVLSKNLNQTWYLHAITGIIYANLCKAP